MSEVVAKTQEEISAAIDAVVDQAISTEASAEVVEKSEKPGDSAEVRGGEDKRKSGSPAQEENPGAAPAEEKKDKKKMKKSLEELAEDLSEDEIELLKAWREETGEVEVIEEAPAAPAINVEDIAKSVRASIAGELETLSKALTAKDDMIKSLSAQVEKLSSQPAYDKRSLETLEAIEKGGEEAPVQKSQVLNKMLELQREGKGINSLHIAEFESTGNISDPRTKAMVMNSFKS